MTLGRWRVSGNTAELEQQAGEESTWPWWSWWLYEGTMAVLALVVVVLLAMPHTGWYAVANWVIWAVFAGDYIVRLVRAPDRWAFVRSNIPDLIAAFPLDLFRVARLAKLARLIRAVRIVWRVTRNLRGIAATNGLGWLLLLTGLVVCLGGFAAWLAEDEFTSVGDAIWWSIVTTTTVGYGDISPSSVEGRVVATILMFVGIGTIGMITATFATFFVGQTKRGPGNNQVSWIRDQLEGWEELDRDERRRLAAMLTGLADMPDPPDPPVRPDPPDRERSDGPSPTRSEI